MTTTRATEPETAEFLYPDAAKAYREIIGDASLPLDDDLHWCMFVEGWARREKAAGCITEDEAQKILDDIARAQDGNQERAIVQRWVRIFAGPPRPSSS